MPLPDLMADAACDPALIRELRLDPASAYARYGLHADEIALIEARDKPAISRRIPSGTALAMPAPPEGRTGAAGAGWLLVAGTGITGIAHLTLETVAAVEQAEVVFYLVIDQLTINWIVGRCPGARPLYHHYRAGLDRRASYAAMITEILAAVRAGRRVTALFYGHPGVLAYPGHGAIAQARAEGFFARMLPGVSADACLLAELGIDPATDGLQAFEATQLLRADRDIDVRTPMILWQAGVVGDTGYAAGDYARSAFDALIARLIMLYGTGHRLCVYEASEFAALPPTIVWKRIEDVRRDDLSAMCTMFIPARHAQKLCGTAINAA